MALIHEIKKWQKISWNCPFKKEQCEWFTCDSSKPLTKFIFFVCVWQFSPFLCPRANHTRRSSLIPSFLNSNLSDSLLSLCTKERPWAIHSGCSWQKSYGSDSPFFTVESHFRSFAHKKWGNCSKTDEQIPNPDIIVSRDFSETAINNLFKLL